MKTFDQTKTYIIEEATKLRACSTELNRAKNATTIDDLLSVVADNLSWVSERKLFNGQNIEEYFPKEKLIEFNLANTGAENIGFANTGDRNTGDSNTGDSNTGNRNTGYRNTGDRNTGDSNTGDWNTGYRNTGDWNTGYSNTGYSNTGNRNTGAFCTGEAPFPMFNKPSNWTAQDFLNSRAYALLCQVDTKLWIWTSDMTEKEKEDYPSHATTGGYLKDIPYKEAFQNRWDNWSEENREAFTSLPNFDPEVFEIITGVRVEVTAYTINQ